MARAINVASPRAQAPFVPVNCAGIPETLLESELFGHVKGSFTGAYRDKPGKLEMADNGTIFLDEIGEMSLRMQGLLLRFLETGEIQKVGADHVNRVTRVRVMAATNRNLADMIARDLFREDLFYRINVIHLFVPPLRERREDIPLLVDRFLERFAERARSNGAPVEAREFGPFDYARGHGGAVRVPWPGNVRQVENVIERLVVTCRHEAIRLDDLSPEFRTPGQFSLGPRRERRRTIADDLFQKLVD